MKKTLLSVLCAAMIVTQFVACSQPEEGNGSQTGGTASKGDGTSVASAIEGDSGFKAPDDANVDMSGEKPTLIETTSLVVGRSDNSNVTDFETNLLTLWYEENANVDLTFELYPSKEAAEKARVQMSSNGQLPDIYTGFALSDADVLQFGSQGAIIPLNDYYEKYGYYSKMMFEQSEYIKPLITAADGNLYSVPRVIESTPNEWASRAWINSEWLAAVGMEVPTTTDELYDVLKAFKDQDPNGNGTNDEIPLVGSVGGWHQQPYEQLMNAFIYCDANTYYLVEDGVVDVAFNKDEWREGLSYMAMLCEEELLSPLSFTQDESQLKAITQNADAALAGVVIAGSVSVFGATDRVLEYEALPPLEGPDGVSNVAFTPSIPQQQFFITKSCENPAAAFILGDQMLSYEAAVFSRFGVEGVDHVLATEDDVGMLENLGYDPILTPILNWGEIQNTHWAETTAVYRTYDLTNGQTWDGNDKNFQYIICSALPTFYDKGPDEAIYKLIYTEEETDDMKDLDATINGYVQESIAAFITGTLDVDSSDWDNYIEELNRMGLEEYIELSQTAYTRMQSE